MNEPSLYDSLRLLISMMSGSHGMLFASGIETEEIIAAATLVADQLVQTNFHDHQYCAQLITKVFTLICGQLDDVKFIHGIFMRIIKCATVDAKYLDKELLGKTLQALDKYISKHLPNLQESNDLVLATAIEALVNLIGSTSLMPIDLIQTINTDFVDLKKTCLLFKTKFGNKLAIAFMALDYKIAESGEYMLEMPLYSSLLEYINFQSWNNVKALALETWPKILIKNKQLLNSNNPRTMNESEDGIHFMAQLLKNINIPNDINDQAIRFFITEKTKSLSMACAHAEIFALEMLPQLDSRIEIISKTIQILHEFTNDLTFSVLMIKTVLLLLTSILSGCNQSRIEFHKQNGAKMLELLMNPLENYDFIPQYAIFAYQQAVKL